MAYRYRARLVIRTRNHINRQFNILDGVFGWICAAIKPSVLLRTVIVVLEDAFVAVHLAEVVDRLPGRSARHLSGGEANGGLKEELFTECQR